MDWVLDGRSSVARALRWCAPYGMINRLINARTQATPVTQTVPNEQPDASIIEIRAKRRGRCFILANGPTVSRQNLALLRGEQVISVSNGYRHPDFPAFAPVFHCVPQITYRTLTPEDVVKWFAEMHQRIGSADLFLSESERELVETNRLFEGRVVRYLKFQNEFAAYPGNSILDLSMPVPLVQSVTIMCLMVAMYAGFDEIYLLGVEHDHFRTGRYEYFYKDGVVAGKDFAVNQDGQVINPLYDEFAALFTLWSQYRHMKQIALANGVSILNATAGGALDEFERVEFESLFPTDESRHVLPAGAAS